jgi:calcium channel MID1
MLLLLYFTFSSPHFAYASNIDSIQAEDHNHEQLLRGPFFDLDPELPELELRDELSYESEFLGVDRGIIGRAPTSDEPKPLINNVRQTDNVPMGTTQSYVFTNSSLFGNKSTTQAYLIPIQYRKRSAEVYDIYAEREVPEDADIETWEDRMLLSRQSALTGFRTLYITVNTCAQPQPVNSQQALPPPPQLQLYISQSTDNKNPGPGKSPQDMVELDGGYGLYEVNATSDVFIGLYGVNDTTYSGVWNAEIAASIDAPFHYFHGLSSNLSLVDSDSSSAYLLVENPMRSESGTSGLQQWSDSPPYVLFGSDASKTSISGLENSYCGLQNNADIIPANSRPGVTKNNVQSWLTKRGAATVPDQKFYVDGLTKGTKYNAILAMTGNSTSSENGVVGGGGQVFRLMKFDTTSGKTHSLFRQV